MLGINELKSLEGHSDKLENAMLKKAFLRFLRRTSEFMKRENAMLIAKNDRIDARINVFITKIENDLDGSNTGALQAQGNELSDGADHQQADSLPQRGERGNADPSDTE